MIVLEANERRVAVRAPAKLNLYLDVLGKRGDGFHELESVMQTITLYDELVVERSDAPGVRLRVEGRECPSGPGNLVVRAAETLLSAMQERTGLSLFLQKNTPLGAGLGGGSSDAAGTLLAVARLLGEGRVDRDELSRIAATLGSDVPFFLIGGTAIARGRGERIEPIEASDTRSFDYVVLYPGREASTPRVYGALDLSLTFPRHNLRHFCQQLRRSAADNVPNYYNALTTPFRASYPELARLQDRVVAETGRVFHVTGSGSAMFCVVRDEADGEGLLQELGDMRAGEAFSCRGPAPSSDRTTADPSAAGSR